MKNKEVIKNVPSEEKVAEWDAKETTEGAQAKADKALNDAKTYADEHKVEKVEGKQLSTEDFTTEEKTKLALLKNYTHPAKHTTDDITTNSSSRFVSDAQVSSWDNKETVEGSKAKADKALEDAKAYIETKVNPLKTEKLDFAEINQQRQLVLKANGAIKYTLQLPLGGGDGSSNYVLPAATSTLLGGVKIGAGISVKEDGTISVNMSDIGSLSWENISGKPLEFAPSSHNHNKSEIIGMFNVINNLESNSATDALSAKQGKELRSLITDASHTHSNLTALNQITTENINLWNDKETKTGSQEKASKAYEDAKVYADLKMQAIPTMQYYKTTIEESAWALFNDLSNLYKTTVVHNLSCLDITIEAFNSTSGISEFISYRVVDANSIELFAEVPTGLKLTVLGFTQKE